MKLGELYPFNCIKIDTNEKEILKGLNLEINKGEIHVIMGPNGSGKSTLANTIFHSPKYIITDGNIKLHGEELTNKKTDEIARLGVFMSFQTPVEIPGINLAQFLTSTKKSMTGKKPNIFTFQKEVEKNMQDLNMKSEYISREFNVGFSGGEKKKNEILQMLILNPKLAILDETDSGLDVDAVHVVSKGIEEYQKSVGGSLLIITHNARLLENMKIDYTHVLVNGSIVKTGDGSLVEEINKEGFEKYIK